MARGSQRGSRLHHWLPRPSLVPNFPRTGVVASTSCPMYLRPPSNHKGWYCASRNCCNRSHFHARRAEGLQEGCRAFLLANGALFVLLSPCGGSPPEVIAVP